MSSRQEEKERRRAERQALEEAERRKAATRRRLQMVAGGILAVAAIAAVVIAIASGGGGDDGDGPDADRGPTTPIPARKLADLNQAAKAAGCEVKTFSTEGRDHFPDNKGVNNDYKSNPPTSGKHRPEWAEDGIYDPGNEPAKENWVHSLEHGRVIYQYAPGTPARRISQLETLYNEPLRGLEGYHQLLLQNNTKMPYAVSAVAWTQLVGCKEFNDKAFDALRAFRDRFVDKGPEVVP